MDIKAKLSYSLSNHDLMKYMKGKCKIYTYNELSKFNNLEEAFENTEVIFLLYETIKNYGHWCSILKRKNSIEFFDPYGIFPDEELKFTDDVFRLKNNMILPHLTYLLWKSRKRVEYNNYKLQSKKFGINTCGRWNLIRAQYKDINIDNFAKLLTKNNIPNDVLITLLTYYI